MFRDNLMLIRRGLFQFWYIAACAALTCYLLWLVLHRENRTSFTVPINKTFAYPVLNQQTPPRLFCMVITSPETLTSKAFSGVSSTWGKRCDRLVFISSVKLNNDSRIISCNCTEGYDYLWGKVKAGFIQVNQRFNRGEFDWFLKADDDTYVIIENLKSQLSRLDPKKPLVLGRRISAYVKGGYMAGGSGYVLSKAALRNFVNIGLKKKSDHLCKRKEKGIEDIEMGLCLHSSGVTFVDTRDPGDKKETFIPHDPIESLTVVHNISTFWLHLYNFYRGYGDLSESFSSRPISFHRISTALMKTLDFFIYQFKMDTSFLLN